MTEPWKISNLPQGRPHVGSAFFDTGYRRGAGGAAAGKEGGVGYHALRLRRPGGSPCGNREEG